MRLGVILTDNAWNNNGTLFKRCNSLIVGDTAHQLCVLPPYFDD